MVGVPGKSQGCNTCRKRKIKCDGEKPSCGQCKRGKRECGGYQRDRHFKNLSALDRDTLLARAQPLAPLTEPSAIIYSTPSPFSSHTPVNKDQDLVPPRTELQQLQQEGQESTNLSELFYHLVSHYFPRDDWVQFLVPLQGTNFSLDLAMSALSMVRLGRLNHDETLRRQGLANYGKALEGMYDILESGEMWCEQTLASCMVFLIFEVFEASGENINGWISHIRGVSRLFQLRGPQMHVSESSHRLFLGFRPTGVILALATRKATYLGEEDWLNIPWTIFPKSDFHHLLDIMARMPALVELTECLGREVDSEDIAVQKLDCLQQNWDFHSQLENWYHSLSKKSPVVLYSTEPTTSFFTKSMTDPELENVFPTSLSFPTFDIARMHCFYWAALLRLYHNISILQPSAFLVHNRSIEVATLIAQSVQYLLSEEMQTRGPLNIFFPLSMAMHTFSRKQGEGQREVKEVRWCKLVFEELDERGFPFGRILVGWDWDDIPVIMLKGV
ncbi:hypothetical protein LTR41_003099 [Exophiala xenobiotica]|nr:hypothetical protein LTR41_003099 [Exophiala xenobiotica]